MNRRTSAAEALFGLHTDMRHHATRLAATLYAVGALTLLVSTTFLPADVDRTAVLGTWVVALSSWRCWCCPGRASRAGRRSYRWRARSP